MYDLAWRRTPNPVIDRIAEENLTRREYEVWRQTEAGLGHRRIALAMGLSVTRVRDLRESGARRLLKALADERDAE